jgi:hypothetical protein
LINFGQKNGASNYLGYRESYRIRIVFCIRKYCFKQANHYSKGNTIKPDRMVVNQLNEVYLLDYKTGAHNAKIQKQLNYQHAIELMGIKS